MTHSAGQRGYKASAAAASKDDELYGTYSEAKEDWPVRNGIPARNGGPKQPAKSEINNMGNEAIDQRNR